MKRINILLTSLVFCLCACQRSPSNQQEDNLSLPIKAPAVASSFQAKTFVYQCSNDYSFVARNDTFESIWLFLPQETLQLHHVRSASGVKYQNSQAQFWSKGEDAFLDYARKQYKSCRNNRMLAVWEHSKLNGFDFRAVGNEPGWVLEISQEAGIVFKYDYGQSVIKFLYRAPNTNSERRRSEYSLNNGEAHIKIILEGKICQDTMVEQQYESTVTVQYASKTYKGCGKSLH